MPKQAPAKRRASPASRAPRGAKKPSRPSRARRAPAAESAPSPAVPAVAPAETPGFWSDLAVGGGLLLGGFVLLRWSYFLGVTAVVLGVHLVLHSLSTES